MPGTYYLKVFALFSIFLHQTLNVSDAKAAQTFSTTKTCARVLEQLSDAGMSPEQIAVYDRLMDIANDRGIKIVASFPELVDSVPLGGPVTPYMIQTAIANLQEPRFVSISTRLLVYEDLKKLGKATAGGLTKLRTRFPELLEPTFARGRGQRYEIHPLTSVMNLSPAALAATVLRLQLKITDVARWLKENSSESKPLSPEQIVGAIKQMPEGIASAVTRFPELKARLPGGSSQISDRVLSRMIGALSDDELKAVSARMTLHTFLIQRFSGSDPNRWLLLEGLPELKYSTDEEQKRVKRSVGRVDTGTYGWKQQIHASYVRHLIEKLSPENLWVTVARVQVLQWTPTELASFVDGTR